jgi:hypothetical protein
MSAMECSRLYDLAPELALGLLDGAERAEVLAHLERCAKCHADVASLTELGEQLLLLAPQVPPPAGFETRVLARLAPGPALSAEGGTADGSNAGAGDPGDLPRHLPSTTIRSHGPRGRRPRRFPRRLQMGVAAVAAVTLLVVAFVGLLVGMSGDDSGTDPGGNGDTSGVDLADARSTPMEDATGETVGEARLLDGAPPTLQLDLADWVDDIQTWDDPPHGPWTLRVVDDTGTPERYDLPADDVTPAIELDHGDLGDIHSVALLDVHGQVWCSGTFE